MHAEAQQRKEHLRARSYLHKGTRINLRQDTLTTGKTFEIIEHPGAVAILPFLDHKILLIRQWRRAVEKILYEIPAGTLEENEDLTTCAQRELQEEIGYKAGNLIPFGSFFTAPGFCTEYIHLFLAENLQASRLIPDEDEGIDLAIMSLSDAIQLIEKGEIIDAKTIIALYKYVVSTP